MENTRILILDCKGAAKPAICFTLEIAGFLTYVVKEENEAINLLSNALRIEKSFSCLLVNDCEPEKDPACLLEAVERCGVGSAGCAIVFVCSRETTQDNLAPLLEQFPHLNIYTCQPSQAVNLISALQKGAA